MIFKNYTIKLAFRVILLALNIAWFSYLVLSGESAWLFLSGAILIYQLAELFMNQKRVYRELEEFSEAVHYRDFSRNFNVNRSPAELQPLRASFNVITDTFKQISREKETHYHYLQHIMEIVGTGIISYEEESGLVAWMNDSFKNMLNLPHYKNIMALEKRNSELYRVIREIKPGDSKIFEASVEQQNVKLLLSATIFSIEGKVFKLLSVQNINDALDQTEADAWSRLLAVMTHEIMNSIAPISSLADTLKNRIAQSIGSGEAQPSYREDLELGIETIGKRSEALLKFADTYRNLSRINSLDLKQVFVRDVFETQHRLMMPTLSDRKIELEIVLKDPHIKLMADVGLVEQVLINLILNSMEAVRNTENPRIVLSAFNNAQKKCVLKVTDNGHGVPPELLDRIFIPFFSTKKNGTGIGLNLCKQIMLLHKGSIHAQRLAGGGTSFVMTFE